MASSNTQDLAGLVDPRIKLSIGLYGAPAMNAAQFARVPRPRTVVGGSVTVVPPWGQYAPAQLVNLGFNRWAVKPEVGVSHQIDRWTVEWYAGTWLFTANNQYFPSRAVKQQDAGVLGADACQLRASAEKLACRQRDMVCRRSDAHRSCDES